MASIGHLQCVEAKHARLHKMNHKPLPTKLAKEPLVDAVFEVRFSSSIPASNVLPGLFFASISSVDKKLDRLPAADFPSQMRKLDPNLRFQPLLKLQWDDFVLLLGDESLAVACPIPYPGWPAFRSRIADVLETIKNSHIIEAVNRYSLKYVDIIDGETLSEQIKRVNIHLSVGEYELSSEGFNIRVDIPDGDYVHLLQIAAPSAVTLPDGKTRPGVLVSVDSVRGNLTMDLEGFSDTLASSLEDIHERNKTRFFSCLRPETITYLEPTYE